MTTNVLLVEDSSGDARLTEEAFRGANPDVRIHTAFDGVEGMAFLRRERGHSNAPRPDLVLLDLNLPRMDGRQVLALIKGDDSLKTIPTLILTTSKAEIDIANSYRLQANAYVTKPAQWDDFECLVISINDFWLAKAKLPPRPREI